MRNIHIYFAGWLTAGSEPEVIHLQARSLGSVSMTLPHTRLQHSNISQYPLRLHANRTDYCAL